MSSFPGPNDPLPPERRLQVDDLEVKLAATGEHILKGVSFYLRAGEIFALVGESGSGKSVSSLGVMRLLPEALQITAGNARMHDADLFGMTEKQMQTVRGRRVAMIFQNAMSSLNPVQKVEPPVEITPTVEISSRQSSPSGHMTSTLQEPDMVVLGSSTGGRNPLYP